MFHSSGQVQADSSLNRHQRRSLSAALKKAKKEAAKFYSEPTLNGIKFTDLAKPAYLHLEKRLQDFGNILSTEHKDALLFQIGIFTLKAQGQLSGRHQISLPPGCGKTQGVISWLKALTANGGHDHVGVAVAASKVEELASIKRELLAVGVPAEKIALWHSLNYDSKTAQEFLSKQTHQLPDGYASEPSDMAERQIVLVTHARVMSHSMQQAQQKSNTALDRQAWSHWRSKPRFVIFDESLIKSRAVAIPIVKLKTSLAVFEIEHRDRLGDQGRETCRFLDDCLEAISEAYRKAEETGEEDVLHLCPEDPQDLQRHLETLPKRDFNMRAARDLLSIIEWPLKVVRQSTGGGHGGVITYDIVVPEHLQNVAILDASYPIRDLVRRDTGIIEALNDPAVKDALSPYLSIPQENLHRIKKYHRVVIHQLRVPGGRTAMEGYWDQSSSRSKLKTDNPVAQEVVEVVKGIPQGESVLIFVFKDRSDGRRYRETILEALRQAGVDTEETLETPETKELRKRISVLTWGQETAINSYSHCSNVILAGVIRRNPLELEASITGQEEDLSKAVSSRDVSKADLGEVLHSVFQALNRGSCRVIQNGHARHMKAWIIHKEKNIQSELEEVMPGVKFTRWEPKFFDPKGAKACVIADKITSFLETYGAGDSISFRALRKALEMTEGQAHEVPDRTWANGRSQSEEELPSDWTRVGNSYARLFPA